MVLIRSYIKYQKLPILLPTQSPLCDNPKPWTLTNPKLNTNPKPLGLILGFRVNIFNEFSITVVPSASHSLGDNLGGPLLWECPCSRAMYLFVVRNNLGEESRKLLLFHCGACRVSWKKRGEKKKKKRPSISKGKTPTQWAFYFSKGKATIL